MESPPAELLPSPNCLGDLPPSSVSQNSPGLSSSSSGSSSRSPAVSSKELLAIKRALKTRFTIKHGVEPMLQLADNEEEVMTSELLEPINITFSNTPEQHRQKNKGKIVPPNFWRTSYETSVTLSSNTSKATHAKHRERKDLKLHARNAFQPVAPWKLPRDLNRERIERHLIWNKKENPSSYISTFNFLSHAVRRARFHYDTSKRIGHRVFISKINNVGLVAATVSARCKTTVRIIKKERFKPDVIESVEHFFDVDIPVWIRDPRAPKDRSNLTVEQFEKLGADMWISITELRTSNLSNGPKSRVKASRDYICAQGHDYEWLCCGPIAKSFIMNVMPFDGKELYKKQTTKIIRSLDSTEPWVWSWDEKRWVLDAALINIAEWRDMEAHQAREALKRKADGLDSLDNLDEGRPAKRGKMIELNIVRPYMNSPVVRKSALTTG